MKWQSLTANLQERHAREEEAGAEVSEQARQIGEQWGKGGRGGQAGKGNDTA